MRLHKKLPSAPPASTTCKPHSSRGRGRPELGPSRLRDHGSICESISGAAPSSLLPTGHENILVMTDSRSGRRSFDSKLISLLPLDEVPVHVHRFAARVPCDSKGSECQCGIHTAEAASALRSRKTERAAKEKPTPISQFF